MFRQRARRIAVALGVWALVALLFIAQNVVADLSRGRPIDWRRDAAEESLYWLAFALLTPLLLWLTRRRRLAVHLLASPAVAALQVAIYFALLRAIGVRGTSFLILLMIAYWKYWVIVGLLHGLAYAKAAAELRAQLAAAQLERLRAQLQPHFLFNALNSIAVLLRDDPERARTMVVGLSELLRAVIDSGAEQLVPLRRELAFIERYLAIQQIRFGERLRVTLDISADQDREIVPHFLIQPLVENAVQHGIAKSESGGTVRVAAARQGGDLLIDVTDTPADPAERGAEEPGSGVGLANTRERLETLYGSTASLTLDPHTHGGMRVTVRLPSRVHVLTP